MPGIADRIRRNPKRSIAIVLALLLLTLDVKLEKIYFPVDSDVRSARTSHIFYHHGLRDHVHSEAWWGHIHYIFDTNSLGFKDRTMRDVPLRTDKWRIVFLGDSFTGGLGIDEEQTFVGRVEDAFEDKG